MTAFQRVIKYVGIGLALFLTVSIIGSICAVAVGFGGKKMNFSKVKTVSGVEDFEDITGFDIDSGVVNVKVETGNHFQVTKTNVPSDIVIERKSDGTLYIKQDQDFFEWFGQHDWSKNSSILITVPKDYTAKEFTLESGTGNVELNDITVKELDLDAGTGNITGKNLVADEATINGGTGNINLSAVRLNDVDTDCGVGDIDIEGQITGESSFDCGVGNVDLEIEGSKEEYSLDIEAGVGTVRVNGEKMKDISEEGGRNSLDIQGGVGSVEVNFTQDK